MIYFTADTHFGHEAVIHMCGRPFDTLEEMNEALIANWNSRVKGTDTIYILGDLFFRCEDPEAILRRLKGRKHLLLGNHDSSWIRRVDLRHCFVRVERLIEEGINETGMTLCHYPLLTWRHQKRSFMIHGHLHRKTSDDFWPLLCARERTLNAGVDINGYRPVTLEELIENNRIWKDSHRPTTE
ncbi:MAG: metallophosphoesterase [Clostridia bacterium]|nr:metallophosphoesterase [Clostridia bacterium]